MSAALVIQLRKPCTKCGQEKERSEFFNTRDKKGRPILHSQCKACTRLVAQDRYYNRGGREKAAAQSSYAYHNTDRGQKSRDQARVFARDNWSRRLIYSCRVASRQRTARGRVCPVAITHQHLEELWEKQGGLCYFTGVPLATVQHRLDTVSTDRIDPKHGYIPGNVVLSTKAANFARTGHGADEFLVFLMRMAKALPNAPCAKGIL